jgi:hypothetical protein
VVGVGCVGWFAFDGWFTCLHWFNSHSLCLSSIYLTVLVSRFFWRIRPLLFDQHEPHFFLRGCSCCLSVNFVVLVSTRFRHDL